MPLEDKIEEARNKLREHSVDLAGFDVLMDSYKIKKDVPDPQLQMVGVNPAQELAGIIGQIVSNNWNIGAWDLIDFLNQKKYIENPAVSLRIAESFRRISPYFNAKLVFDLISLDEYKMHPNIAARISYGFGGLSMANEFIGQFVRLLKQEEYKKKPETAAQIAETAGNIEGGVMMCSDIDALNAGACNFVLQSFFDVCVNLSPEHFEPHVYKEFGELIMETYLIRPRKDEVLKYNSQQLNENLSKIKGMVGLLDEEIAFFNQLPAESALPVFMIFTRAGEGYVDKIKKMEPDALKNLSDAWAIAKNHPTEIPMEKFYELLKGSLDRGTADKWARAIVEGYGKRKDEGLKRVLKDGA